MIQQLGQMKAETMSSRVGTVKLLAVALGVTCLLLVASMGVVSATDDDHSVEIEPADDTLVEGENQTIAVTVEEKDGSDMIFPLVEVPLGDDLTIADELLSDRDDGTQTVDGVTVTINGESEDRLAFVDDSSFRDGDALFIEGELLPANAEKTYEFDLTIETTSETTLEADFRPLNAEEHNTRDDISVNPTAVATIDAAFDVGENTVSVDGVEGDGQIEARVAGGNSYDVTGDISLLPEPVTVSITAAEYTTELVRFTDVDTGGADEPVVVAKTGADAEVIQGSTTETVVGASAEENTTLDLEFDFVASSGTTQIVVEEREERPVQGIANADVFENAELIETASDDAVRMEFEGAADELVSVGLEGYRLGDVTLDNTVSDGDAAALATALAAGETVTEYADVTDDGEFSAADAMKIQQYAENNRTAEYEVSD